MAEPTSVPGTLSPHQEFPTLLRQVRPKGAVGSALSLSSQASAICPPQWGSVVSRRDSSCCFAEASGGGQVAQTGLQGGKGMGLLMASG